MYNMNRLLIVEDNEAIIKGLKYTLCQENFEIDPMFGKIKDSLIYQNAYYRNADPEDPYISCAGAVSQ